MGIIIDFFTRRKRATPTTAHPAARTTRGATVERMVQPRDVFRENHISYSRIKTFKTCPKKFEFSYLCGLEDRAGKAAQIGSVVHKTLELYSGDVLEGRQPHESAGIDTLCGYIDKAMCECDTDVRLTHHDIQPCLSTFQFLNRDLKHTVELELRNECAINGYDFVSIIDRIDECNDEKTLIDYKTGNPKYVRNMQLQTYAFALNKGEYEPHRLEYQFLKIADTRNWKYTRKLHQDTYDWIFSNVDAIERTSYFKPCRTPLCNYCAFQPICG